MTAGLLILDTNVVSALMHNEAVVENWARRFPTEHHFTTAVTVAEILFGVELMPAGKRKDQKRALAHVVIGEFESKVLPFDDGAAEQYARIAAARRRSGLSCPPADLQIAAIASLHRGAVVTRNTKDFAGAGIEVINPWQG